MIILDQLVLASFSMEAMTSASTAAVWSSTLQYSIMTTTTVVGAFVGNYNGAKKFDLAGEPVWHMIWFAISTFCISIPASIFASKYCVPPNLYEFGIPYFEITMFFTPVCGICHVLSGFFVAIGRGIFVTISVFIANIINVVADIIFVFGYFGIDNFTGSKGAAVGTVVAWTTNLLILSGFFFRKSIRYKYGTAKFKFQLHKLIKYLKLGAAGGIGHICEMIGWSLVYHTLASVGTEVAMVQSIAVSVNIGLAFVVSGLEKGVMAITSNLLGANMKHKVANLLKRGITIHMMFTTVCATGLFFFPEIITKSFIRFEVAEEVIRETHLVLRFVTLYFMLDGICWVLAGILEAGGDIGYTMGTVAVSNWCIVNIPTFIISKLGCLNVRITWTLLIISVITVSTILYRRFKSDRWIHIRL
jgi:MATE family multidrug resistance protein